MKNKYIDLIKIPDFDKNITAAISINDFDGGGNEMIIAIENHDQDVYRLISTTGLNEFIGIVNAILEMGFKDLLADSASSKEGYDCRFRPNW